MSRGSRLRGRTGMSLSSKSAIVASAFTHFDLTDVDVQMTTTAREPTSSRRITSENSSPDTRLVSHQTLYPSRSNAPTRPSVISGSDLEYDTKTSFRNVVSGPTINLSSRSRMDFCDSILVSSL